MYYGPDVINRSYTGHETLSRVIFPGPRNKTPVSGVIHDWRAYIGSINPVPSQEARSRLYHSDITNKSQM